MLSITSLDRSAAKVKQIDYPDFSQPLVSRPPLKSCEVCVIVPVRNEADALKNTLLALSNQVDLIGKLLNKSCYEIIVLVNNCTDDSAEIARRFASSRPNLMLHQKKLSAISRQLSALIDYLRSLLKACELWV